MKFKTVIFLSIAMIMFSCSKVSPTINNLPSNQDTTSTPIDTSHGPIVYVVGDIVPNSGGLTIPVYWENGVATQLPNPAYSYASGIALNGNDVYISNYGAYNGNTITYWKNGIGISLPDTFTIYQPAATSIAIRNNNVFIAGIMHALPYFNYEPTYWENNGYGMKVQTKDAGSCNANSIAVSGNDIYVAGSMDALATYWKNGVSVTLVDTPHYTSIVNSIAVIGNDVYAAGTVDLTDGDESSYFLSTAVLWKNGVPTPLTADAGSAATSMFVSGTDIYIAGAIYNMSNEQPKAAYWKNGTLVVLDTNYSTANSIVVQGTDVYVAGNIGFNQAIYWKNGKAVTLQIGNAYGSNAYGIAVEN